MARVCYNTHGPSCVGAISVFTMIPQCADRIARACLSYRLERAPEGRDVDERAPHFLVCAKNDIDRREQNEDTTGKFLKEGEFREAVGRHLLGQAIARIREDADTANTR